MWEARSEERCLLDSDWTSDTSSSNVLMLTPLSLARVIQLFSHPNILSQADLKGFLTPQWHQQGTRYFAGRVTICDGTGTRSCGSASQHLLQRVILQEANGLCASLGTYINQLICAQSSVIKNAAEQ